MIVYFNNEFVPKENVNISPDDRGFVFGDGAYEVIRVYNGKMFRADDHLKRLSRSLKELYISDVDVEKFKDISEKLIQDNHLEQGDATVYIQVTRGVAPRKHAFPVQETAPTVYAAASPFQIPQQQWEQGIKIILVSDIRWTRCDIKTVALLPNVLANQQAKEEGAGEAVFVRDGALTEGTHTNFCAVMNGELNTFPESNYILSGITRKVVLELCRALKIPVREFPVLERDLKKIEECMVIGTTTEVMPVIQINDFIVGNGKPGPVTLKLQRAFQEVTNR